MFLQILIRYINLNIELKSVSYEGRTYLNRSNRWYDRKEEGKSYDPDVRCDGYDECIYNNNSDEDSDDRGIPNKFYVLDSRTIQYNVGYSLVGDNIVDNIGYYVEHEDNVPPEWLISIFEEISGENLKDIELNFGKIYLTNPCGVNEDHRGSDHTCIILDFEDEYILYDGCTLYDLAVACFRLRSHKFVNNYEMFLGSKVVKTDSGYSISMLFDHWKLSS